MSVYKCADSPDAKHHQVRQPQTPVAGGGKTGLLAFALFAFMPVHVCVAQIPLTKQPANSESKARKHLNDNELVGLCNLIEDRLAYIEQVSRSKWNSQSAIEDPVREQALLQDVEVKATQIGLPPKWTQHFFRLQMEASKQVEYQLFAEWRQRQQEHFSDTLDLKSQIRPQLDRMTDSLLSELKSNWPVLASKDAQDKVRACHVRSAYPHALDIALSPLIDRSAETMASAVPVAP